MAIPQRSTTTVKSPAAPIAAPAVPTSRKSATSLVVACKVPIGLDLQLCVEDEYPEDIMGGGKRMTKRFIKMGPILNIRGPAYPIGPVPKGLRRAPTVVGGYALTTLRSSVPVGEDNNEVEFFEQWMDQNKRNPLVESRMIFGYPKSEAIGIAKELKDTKSGLEAVDPESDSRLPRSMNGAVGKIETAEEMQGRGLPEAEDFGDDD